MKLILFLNIRNMFLNAKQGEFQECKRILLVKIFILYLLRFDPCSISHSSSCPPLFFLFYRLHILILLIHFPYWQYAAPAPPPPALFSVSLFSSHTKFPTSLRPKILYDTFKIHSGCSRNNLGYGKGIDFWHKMELYLFTGIYGYTVSYVTIYALLGISLASKIKTNIWLEICHRTTARHKY